MSVKCLIYCTKAKPYISYDSYDNTIWKTDKEYSLNGKIVASFDCEKVEKIVATKWSVGFCCGCAYYHFETKDLLRKSCLKYGDLCDYLENQNGYAIHISNLEIFDEPKDLYEYDIKLTPQKLVNPISKDSIIISNITYSCTKAPQNMCNVYDSQRNHYVLISIRPEWVAKILNGEKTIEVRKVVTNKLKKLIGE